MSVSVSCRGRCRRKWFCEREREREQAAGEDADPAEAGGGGRRREQAAGEDADLAEAGGGSRRRGKMLSCPSRGSPSNLKERE